MAELDETIDGDFIQTRGSIRAKKLRQEADEYAKEIERRQPPAPQEQERLQPGGTLAGRGQEANSLGFSMASDLLKGAVETPRAVIGGARDAVQETLESLDDMAVFLNENLADLSVLDSDTDPELNLPDIEDPTSVTGNVVKGVAQFITGFIPTLKGVRAVTGGKAATRMGQFTQAEAAAAISAAVVFDPHEARLSNLIQEQPALENPVTEYLAASPDDSAAEGRFKNALEGTLMAPLVEGLGYALRAIRANRIEKGVNPAPTEIEPPRVFEQTSHEVLEGGKHRIKPREVTEVDELNGPGHLDVEEVPEGFKVLGSFLPKGRRGQGLAVEMYEHLLSLGKPVLSDDIVSPEAVRVYEALERRGYRITRNSTAAKGDGDTSIGADGPVFTVRPKPANIGRPLNTPDEQLINDLGDVDLDEFLLREAEEAAPTAPATPRFPENINRGPERFKPTPIEAPLFREASPNSVPDLLRMNWEGDNKGLFVTDNPDLALGQGANTGVKVQFKPGWVSAVEHQKPGTAVEGVGKEFRTNWISPGAIESMTMPTRTYNMLHKGVKERVDQQFTVRTEGGTTTLTAKPDASAPKQNVQQGRTANEEAAKAFLESGQLPFDLQFKMNWAKFSSSEQATEVLNDVAQLFAGQIDEARRGKIQDEELRNLARSLGMQPEQLMARQQGGVFNAEQIMASKMILDSASQQVLELARKARTSLDDKDQFAFRRMLDIHAGLQKQMQGAASEAGRAFRALRVPTGSTESQIQQIRETLMKDGGPDKLRSMAEALSEINDPDKINQVIRESFGKRATDAVVEWWYFALLSGPQTHAVNITSNSINTVWQIPERFLAEQVGKTLGNPGVVEGEARELLYGLITAMPDAFRLAGRAFITNEPTDVFNKVEARTQEAITAENFPLGKKVGRVFGEGAGKSVDAAIDGLGTFVRIPTRSLMAQDEFFRTIGKSMESRAFALRQATKEGLSGREAAERIQELIRNPDQNMLDAGQTFARDITFTTPGGRGVRALQTFTMTHPSAKAALPFIRTPANLFKWSGKRTPLAFASSSIRNEIKKGGPEGDLALARIMMGSMAAATFADMAFSGLVTGHGPTDQNQRRVWLETNQPFSIKVGDTFYSYNRGDPFGMLLGAAASYAEIAAGMTDEDANELASAIAIATAESVTNKTWIRGVGQTLDAVTDPKRHAAKWFRDQAATFTVPTGAAQVARIVDPTWRDVQSVNDAIKSRIPGFSDEVPPMRNLFGHPVELEGGLGPDIISPIYTKSEKKSPIADWMLENRVLPDRPGRTRAGVEMTPKQYDRFAELAGHGVKDPMTGMGLEETLNALIEGTHPRSYVWDQLVDGPKGSRADVVRTHINDFRDLAWRQLLEEDAELRQRAIAVRHESERAMREPVMNPSAGEAPSP